MKKLNKTHIELLLSDKIQKDNDFECISDVKNMLNISSTGVAKLLDFITYNKEFIGVDGTKAALKFINLENFY